MATEFRNQLSNKEKNLKNKYLPPRLSFCRTIFFVPIFNVGRKVSAEMNQNVETNCVE